LPEKKPVKILMTSGASCPDALVEGVIKKIVGFFDCTKSIDDVIREYTEIQTEAEISVFQK
jgi:4-hydroxy-3-methylbut-2-enyl diphosphate reductase